MKKKIKDMTLAEFREYCIYKFGNECEGCPFSLRADGFLYETGDYTGYCNLHEPVGLDEVVFEIEVEIPEEEKK